MCLTYPIEGFIFEHYDRSLWSVKGCYQPEGSLIAVPKLYDRLKIKKLTDAYAIISRYYKHYVKFVYEVGREVPVVPLNHVVRIINPIEAVSKFEGLRDEGVVKAALELLEIITDGCGCVAGLSGSLAGGYFTRSSDIDIVVYSDSSACYDLLRRLRYEGVLTSFTYGQAYWEFIDVYEGSDTRFLDLMCKRVLQGNFRGFKYTVRLVDCEHPIVLRDYSMLPEVTLLARIIDSTHSYTTPATYLCEVVSSNTYYVGLGGKVILMTHRIRFTELGEGLILQVKAPLYLTNDYNLVNLDIAEVRLIT